MLPSVIGRKSAVGVVIAKQLNICCAVIISDRTPNRLRIAEPESIVAGENCCPHDDA